MNAAVADLRRQGETLADPLPALLVEAERTAASVALGVHGRRRPGTGETFWEYRRHRSEDGAARIDWRRSARSDALFVRENEWEAAQSVWLWRDGRAGFALDYDRARPTKRRRAAVLLIALASLLTRGGERVGVLGESLAPRSGRVGLDRAARRLADGPGDPAALRSGAAAAHASVVVASDFFEPLDVWTSRLGALAAGGRAGVLVQIVDPAEEDFAYEGRTLFADPGEASGQILIGRAQDVREAYRRRFAAQRAGLRDLARRLGWSFVAGRTDQPAATSLLAIYAALAPQAAAGRR